MSINEHGRPSVSTKRFATALLTEDSGTALTYGDVKEIETDLITVKYTPKMNSASMYASGIAVESYVAKSGGTVDLTVVGLTAEEEADYFGAAVLAANNDLIVDNANDYVPDRMIIWSTQRSDGKMNLYKIMKAKFSNQGEQADTSDDNGVKYTGTSLQADYKALIRSGDIMFKEKKVDPDTEAGAALISAWFETALGGIVITDPDSNSNNTPAETTPSENTPTENTP